jgi:HAD superfamily hydrolase (TIGR01509 family)
VARRLSALLWDVDGTLAETELEGHRLAFNRAFASVDLPWRWDASTYLRLLAISGGRERLAAFLSEAEGVAPPPSRLDALVEAKQNHYANLVAAGELGLRPGVARLIREAWDAGLTQAIVTTSSRRAVEALASGVLGELRQAFSFWICGEDVTVKKPHPEAYQLALAQLPCAADHVLVLEDSCNGLAAASAAGLSCLVSLSQASALEPQAHFATAHAVLDSLGDQQERLNVLRGPACPAGQVTLEWLETLGPA